MKKHKKIDYEKLDEMVNSVGKPLYLDDKNWKEVYNLSMARLDLSNKLRQMNEIKTDYMYQSKLSSQESAVRMYVYQYIMYHDYKKINIEHNELIKISRKSGFDKIKSISAKMSHSKHKKEDKLTDLLSRNISSSSPIKETYVQNNKHNFLTVPDIGKQIEIQRKKTMNNCLVRAQTAKVGRDTIEHNTIEFGEFKLSRSLTLDRGGNMIMEKTTFTSLNK